MSRVSDNSNTAALNYSVNRTKEKLENLQLKGASLKRINRPSDDPVSSVEGLSIKSMGADNRQYMRNISNSLVYLNITEQTLDQVSEILLKAKEIAVAQSSDFYGAEVRKNIGKEVEQMKNQLLALANKRIGNRHLFSGYATLKAPFDSEGNYSGDEGRISIEIAKDFFIPINLTGREVYYAEESKGNKTSENPLKAMENKPTTEEGTPPAPPTIHRDLASIEESKPQKRSNLFGMFTSFISALENNDARAIQDLLEPLDASIERIVGLRTRLGSLTSSATYAQNLIETENLHNTERESKLIDADIAEVFSDLTKQQQVLKTTYQAAKGTMNQSLLDFLR
ncbi:MAG: flagellar hook-associated protein FlgL [Pseudomonadota bacterium]